VSSLLVRLVTSGGLGAIVVLIALSAAGVPVPSEIVVPLGGALAAQRSLPLGGVIAAAVVGDVAGSLVAFTLARRYGETLILGPGRRLGLRPAHLRLAERFFARGGVLAVAAGRCLPVIRSYMAFPAGLSRIGRGPFVIATLAGSTVWNSVLAVAGYELGQGYERVGSLLGPLRLPIALALIALLVAAYYVGKRVADRG
jgi:membrane protein DedA with SNARE-associated domain